MTSRLSRAWVHSDWIVYIAEPSPSRLSTGRPGQATAAPVATGRPWPIAPPVSVEPVVRRGAGRGLHDRGGGGDGLVDDDRALGQQGGDAAPIAAGSSGARRQLRARRIGDGRFRGSAEGVRERLQRGGDVLARAGEHLAPPVSGSASRLGRPG